MNILHIPLNEFYSLDLLKSAFYNLPKELVLNGSQLTDTKNDAEIKLKYQYEYYPTKEARIFYWVKETFENITTYVMYECIMETYRMNEIQMRNFNIQNNPITSKHFK